MHVFRGGGDEWDDWSENIVKGHRWFFLYPCTAVIEKMSHMQCATVPTSFHCVCTSALQNFKAYYPIHTCPVSNTSAERWFSVLKTVKSYLMSTYFNVNDSSLKQFGHFGDHGMWDDQISIDNNEVIGDFAAQKCHLEMYIYTYLHVSFVRLNILMKTLYIIMSYL